MNCPICKGEINDMKCISCNYILSQTKYDQNINQDIVQCKKDIDKGSIILDVRQSYEYECSNIKGILIPLDQLSKRFQELNKEKPIIAHCHSGGRSLHATRFLRQKGFKNVKNMEGGIEAWSLSIDPKVKRYQKDGVHAWHI